MSSREELAWAAGLFEGEGCFRFQETKNGLTRNGVSASLMTTDADVAARFTEVIGFGKLSGPQYRSKPTDTGATRKPIWRWEVSSFENVQAVVAMLWPWLGSRRKQQALHVLRRRLETSWQRCYWVKTESHKVLTAT